jgi:hypothetical protein
MIGSVQAAFPVSCHSERSPSRAGLACLPGRFSGVILVIAFRRVGCLVRDQQSVRMRVSGFQLGGSRRWIERSPVRGRQAGACPTGLVAYLDLDSIGSWRGSRTVDYADPPGWNEAVRSSDPNSWEKGHVLANVFGGSGTQVSNLMTLHRHANNAMQGIEQSIRNGLRSGRYYGVHYRVVPQYDPTSSSRIPIEIKVEAWNEAADGTMSLIANEIIPNRARI